MKRHFRRHLLERDAVTRPSEEPVDGGTQPRVPEGDDETPFLSAPSGREHGGKAVRRTVDGGTRPRVPEGDDETPFSSAPSGLP